MISEILYLKCEPPKPAKPLPENIPPAKVNIVNREIYIYPSPQLVDNNKLWV